MPEANVRIQYLKDGIQACRSCKEMLQNAAERLKTRRDEAQESGWDDDKFRQMSAIVETVTKSLSRPLEQLNHCTEVLNRLLKAVENYETTNLTGQGGADGTGGIDWSTGMNTPEERAILAQVYQEEAAQMPTAPGTGSKEVEQGKKHLPTEKSGTFLGARGDSAFVPADVEARKKLGEFGISSIVYTNGYPDFRPVATHKTPWGTVNTEVQIAHMTTNRQNGVWEFGRRSDAHDISADLGNYEQADNELCAALRRSGVEVQPGDIKKFRIANGLSWHECEDGYSMMLVPTVIHDNCRHSGGVSEVKYRMELASVEDEW